MGTQGDAMERLSMVALPELWWQLRGVHTMRLDFSVMPSRCSDFSLSSGPLQQAWHGQRAVLLEKGEDVAMHFGIVLAHDHMPGEILPEHVLVL
jgi:hypothetical protein